MKGPRNSPFQTWQNGVRLPLPVRPARLFEPLSEFNRTVSQIGGDRVCIHLVNPSDRPRVYRVRPAGFGAKRVDREGCR
jgi:hypothetical protein